jgi:diguanylate cyclase (GGDEF)-like protein
MVANQPVMISSTIFFWVLPLMYAVFTGVFAAMARSDGGSPAARKGAAAFGIGVLAIILDTQREYFPSWFFTLAVPLHWMIIIYTMNAFLTRHGRETPVRPAAITFVVGLAINLGATFIVDSVAIRVPNATITAIALITLGLPQFYRPHMRVLDRLVAGAMTATWICYILRLAVYFVLNQSAEYAQHSQWSQYMLMFYFTTGVITFSLAFLLILTITADMIERHLAAATVDPLTGVPNRRGFEITAAQHAVSPKFGAVMMIDLDRFKAINDEYGHQVGDEVLKATAHTLVHGSAAYGEVARLGGEEFVLLVRSNQAGAVVELAELMRTAIASTLLPAPHRAVRFTTSIGTATIEDGESISDTISRADKALYRAKEAGRDRVGHARSGFSSLSLAAS